jgi:hypothetical protein
MQLVVNDVVETALLTTCVTVFDADGVWLVSPLYAAVIEWEPTDSALLVQPALPLLNGSAEQIGVAPSLNVTDPVGD